MTKSAVRVCVRTRPTAQFAHDQLIVKPESRTIEVNLKKNPAMGVVNNMRENYTFKFDGLLHNSSQETVYHECMDEIVQGVVKGYNGTMLAYGQTGAGKTYTMSGGTESYKARGCIPRAIQQVFGEVSARPDQLFTIRMSYLEIYNETLFDLLAPAGVISEDISELQVIEDSKGAITIKGLTIAPANTEEEAMNLFFEGETNRAIAEHQLNSSSSRSHCILTLHVESRSRVESADRVLVSKLNMVDLAGSERVSKTQSTGAILREAMYINKSLSFLEQCVNALADRGRDHVPFRQSKLTHVLKDSLGGNCRTTMIANIWGESSQLEETISTLNFATRMMRVRNEAIVNVKMDANLLVKKYEQEIRELKQELAMHDALSDRKDVQYDPYSEEQKYDIAQTIRAYCRGEVEEIQIQSMRQVRELLQQFKHLYNSAIFDAKNGRTSAAAMDGQEEEAEEGGGEEASKTAGIGQLADRDGFSIGRAPDGAAPETSVKTAELQRSPLKQGATSESQSPKKVVKKGPPGAFKPDKNQAFEEYKATVGSKTHAGLRDNLAALKDKKANQRELAVSINKCKKEIDELTVQIQVRRETTVDKQDESSRELVVDEEEFALVRTLKERKQAYRTAFEELKVCKSEVEYLNKLAEQARAKLILDFEAWYKHEYEDEDELNGADTVDGEVMDDAEKFDRLEVERVMAEDPDSLAYHNAAKNVFRKTGVGARGKGKRVKGEANPQPIV